MVLLVSGRRECIDDERKQNIVRKVSHYILSRSIEVIDIHASVLEIVRNYSPNVVCELLFAGFRTFNGKGIRGRRSHVCLYR